MRGDIYNDDDEWFGNEWGSPPETDEDNDWDDWDDD